MTFVKFDGSRNPVGCTERDWLDDLHGERFVGDYLLRSENDVFDSSSSAVLCAASMYSLCLLAKDCPYPIIRSFAEWIAGRGTTSASKKGVLQTGGFIAAGMIVPTAPTIGYPTARGVRGKGSYDIGKCAAAFLNKFKCKDGAESGRIHHSKRDKFELSMSAIIPRFACADAGNAQTKQLHVDYMEQRHAVEQFIERAPLFMLHAKQYLHPLICSVLRDVHEYRSIMLTRHLAAGGLMSLLSVATIDVDAANGLLALDITSDHALKGVMDHATAQTAP